jgi:ribonuclease Z
MKANISSIVFVGTSSGQTSLKRFHSSLLIKSPSFNLLVDCGDGISKALLWQNILLDSIDGILFSHLHPDHSAGFPSLIVQMKQLNRTKPLKIFCHKNLIETLRLFLHQTFVFAERSSFEIEYCEFEHDLKVVISEDFAIMSKQNSHLDEYVGYLNDKLTGFESSSFLFELGGNKIFYSGDFGSSKDLQLCIDLNPEILITEAAHIQWETVLDYIKTHKPKVVYLTHFSDDLLANLKKKLKILPQIVRKKIILANDGLSIEIKNSSLKK